MRTTTKKFKEFVDPLYLQAEKFASHLTMLPESREVIDHLILRGRWKAYVVDPVAEKMAIGEVKFGLKLVSQSGQELEFAFSGFGARTVFCEKIYSQYPIPQMNGGCNMEPFLNCHVLEELEEEEEYKEGRAEDEENWKGRAAIVLMRLFNFKEAIKHAWHQMTGSKKLMEKMIL